MIGNLGIVQAQGGELPAVGVEYVLASASGQAILRPLRYPLYDSERLSNTLSVVRTLFTDHKKFADGTQKTEADKRCRLAA